MIQRGKELIRINPSNKQKIEYSTNEGISWISRYSSNSCGEFDDLIDNGNAKLSAMTRKRCILSRNEEKLIKEVEKNK